MAKGRISSRLKKMEDRRNKQQAFLFVLLSIGFLILVILIGSKFFIEIAVWFGNLRTSSSSIISGDNVPPAPPRLVRSLEATNSAQYTLVGFAESGSVAKISLNGKVIGEEVVSAGGEFTYSGIKLIDGENIIKVVAVDSAGNQSDGSQLMRITYDNKPPELTITSPRDGDKFYDQEREIIVAGETDEDVSIRINDFITVVDSTGSFARRFTLSAGDNEIEVVARDEAGNVTKKSIKVNYTQ